jgi:hypothetical protein
MLSRPFQPRHPSHRIRRPDLRRLLLAVLACLAPFAAGPPAGAAPAPLMTWRGALPRGAVRPAPGSERLEFRVFDAPLGGALVAGPFGAQEAGVAGDEVTATFGPVDPALLSGGRRWLEVSAGGASLGRVEIEKVWYDGVDERGALTGGVTFAPVAARAGGAGADAALAYTAMVVNGPSSNRIDLVFVGDGYQSAQLPAFASHASGGLAALFATEPFHAYQTFFNAYRVDVVSTDAGVDHDPTAGILRSTALDMGFWCGGIERLLCVNTTRAWTYAQGAPAVDHVLAVANSTKYGGAGYSGSDLATYSGGNGAAAEVAIHEMGHSIGNLADEYDYADGATYSGGETAERNSSIRDASEMATLGTKWASWLGDPQVEFDGSVSCFQGAAYHQFGLYRPTVVSKMRALGRPFNLPSVEGLLIEFYRIVNPIDAATPAGTVLGPGATAFVDPVDPLGQPLRVRWLLDGELVVEGPTTLVVDSIGVTPGMHTLTVQVTDTTHWVRDEAARASLMTKSRSWTLNGPPPSTAVGDAPAGALALAVAPAPFAAATTLRYRLPVGGRVRLVAFDAAGRALATLRDGAAEAGEHTATFDARGVAPGLVVFRLETGSGTITRKTVRLR